jgi:hypothetical protein
MHGMEEDRPWSTSNYYTFRTARLQKASKNMYLDIRCPGRDSLDTSVLKAQFLTKHAGAGCIIWYDDELLNLALFIIIYIQRQLMYFYSKTNQMYNISNLFYFGTTLSMFRTVSPSIIRSLWLYIQHQLYVIQVLWLLASKLSVYLNLVLGTRTKC